MMRVKFLLDYPGYPVGSVAPVTVDGNGLTPGVVELLQRRGIVKVERSKPKNEPPLRRSKKAK